MLIELVRAYLEENGFSVLDEDPDLDISDMPYNTLVVFGGNYHGRVWCKHTHYGRHPYKITVFAAGKVGDFDLHHPSSLQDLVAYIQVWIRHSDRSPI